jgi:glyoxylase-like metal-dependent hydrolase (beta-lactamase superfamily II)
MITIQSFEFNPFSENTYIVFDDLKEAAIIDPGCYEPHERKTLDQYIADNQLTVKYLLNTHCHIDHVLGNNYIVEKYKVPFLIHQKEEVVLRAVKSYAPNYGFSNYQEATPTGYLKEGSSIFIGQSEWQILFLPGHAPGHVGFYNAEEGKLISGDVLFERSIGRTDLPGGSFETLIHSIHSQLFTLPDNVNVFPGHGDTTTIGEEKTENPFCALNLKA